MFGDHITTGQAVTVCLFSLAVVFIVLLAISYIIDLTAAILKKIGRTPVAPARTPAAQTARSDTADAVLVAASVAAYLGKYTDEFVVRSIRRVRTDETLWGQKARSDSAE